MSLTQRIFGPLFEFSRFLGPLRWKIAVTVFRRLAAIQPNAAWIQRDLGRALSGQAQWDRAEIACRRAVALTPQDGWTYYALAECFVNQKRWTDAIEPCQTALQLESGNPWFRHLYGRVLAGQKNFAAAIAEFQAAVAQDNSVHWFHYHLGETLTKQGRWPEAIAVLERAIELDPDFIWSKYYLSQALMGEDRWEAAIATLQSVKLKTPEERQLFAEQMTYTRHLQQQEQRIQDYCQARAGEVKTGDRPLDILLVTPYPTYPPRLGAITRMFQEVRGLGQRHRLVVASLIFVPQEYAIVEEMEKYCQLSLVALIGDIPVGTSDQPKLIRKYSSQRLEKVLKQLQPVDFDIVCFDFIYMAQYRHLFPNAYTVVGEHNIESDLLKRFAALNQSQVEVDKLAQEASAVDAFADSGREAVMLAAYEDEHWPQFDLRTVVSENERADLLSRCPQSETWVVKNGIDTEATPLLNNWEARKIFFFGTLTYFPNIDGATYLAQEVMPLVWKEEPDLQLCIAGADPPETLLVLADAPRIEVVASPEVMEDVAKDCHISVVPLRVGSGTRIKILHAMAMGLPVVSTSIGCEGLDGVDGEHLLVCDGPEALAEAVLKIDRDRLLWKKLRKQGRSLVEDCYDWQAIYADFEAQLYREWKENRSA